MLHLVQRGGDWAGPQPAQGPPRCTKINRPPINGQCTNFVLSMWHLPLESKGLRDVLKAQGRNYQIPCQYRELMLEIHSL